MKEGLRELTREWVSVWGSNFSWKEDLKVWKDNGTDTGLSNKLSPTHDCHLTIANVTV